MTTNSESKVLILTRELRAPIELVFKVWSEAEHLKHWWGPKGFDIDVKGLDFRPGGYFHYSMSAPDGSKMWGKFNYLEIKPSEKIVWLNSFSDEAGNLVRAPFSDLIPLQIRNEVTFAEQNGVTTLNLHSSAFNANEEERSFYEGMFESMEQGWGGTFEQLEQYVAR
ncbi:SRPBCC family protein [Paenibacillus silvisoli]|uniref:SRPBCC family protein n=1 Tax=Paenibacillus silvisoli TaxID=3110539 RepID=UPI002805A585|nr:SRPBCC domain-containing protein [Paenibacillus silvisoli]